MGNFGSKNKRGGQANSAASSTAEREDPSRRASVVTSTKKIYSSLPNAHAPATATAKPPPQCFVESGSNTGITILLVPHEHTLFCERKERVCSAVGKLQEHERLHLESTTMDLTNRDTSFVWVRSAPGVTPQLIPQPSSEATEDNEPTSSFLDTSEFEIIVGSEGLREYELVAADVGRYLSVRVFDKIQRKAPLDDQVSDSLRITRAAVEAAEEGEANRAHAMSMDSETMTLTDDDDAALAAEDARIEAEEAAAAAAAKNGVVTDAGGAAQADTGVTKSSAADDDDAGTTTSVFEDRTSDSSVAMGPVLAGPPRLLDLCIEGPMTVGSQAVAHIKYIGGAPGASEFWWLRIRDGDREQLSEPRPIDAACATSTPSSGDPRVYVIEEGDVGCLLKVKCRPVRSDGHKGEVFTSKPSPAIRHADGRAAATAEAEEGKGEREGEGLGSSDPPAPSSEAGKIPGVNE